jgi:hypothetical protein
MNEIQDNITLVEREREFLENKLNELIAHMGCIPIANSKLMPYGWRKSAKGRTVWRIVEEVINQSIESQYKNLGFDMVTPAESEVGIYDFKFSCLGNPISYVNIKSAVAGVKNSKDDISKAVKLIEFYDENPNANLYIATFEITFNPDLTIGFNKCIVFPTAWLPDVYVNPSNNGNLQSFMYKQIQSAIKRTPQEFYQCLVEANNIAIAKKKKNIK